MNKDIKRCRCKNCLHDSRDILIAEDEYVTVGSVYYHKDCYQVMSDIDLILNIWHDDIDENVSYSYLRKTLNELIYKQKHPSDYIVFCVRRGAAGRLKHVPGLKYIVNSEDVKKAYLAKLAKKENIRPSDFVVTEEDQREPKFSAPKPKKTGFGSIFGGNKN